MLSKLVLDSSAFMKKIVVRRLTQSSNPTLFEKQVINIKTLPVVYVVKNSKPIVNAVKFDLNFLKKHIKQANLNKIEPNELNEPKNNVVDFGERIKDLNDRDKYLKMIKKFIKYVIDNSNDDEQYLSLINDYQMKKDELNKNLVE